VVFIRGQVIPALNLRARFGFERVPNTSKSRLVVVGYKSRTVGLIVDNAREFMSIPAGSIRPPHEAISSLSGNYLHGIATVGERIILVLDVEQLLGFAETRAEAGRK
jgi:purine-binding chemotaxis protein CheW